MRKEEPTLRTVMFNERKVAQVAAYFLLKRGGKMSHLKLMKLMYLADRQAMDQFGRSISGDQAVSMRHGPVLSQTLDLMDGDVEYSPQGWDTFISAKANHELSLVRKFQLDELDELSPAERQILDQIFKKYGHMRRFDLVAITHKLPEWHDPQGSMLPIATHDIFYALGKKADEIDRLVARLGEDRNIDALFASL
jgi:uncharacterized phage-associated protein